MADDVSGPEDWERIAYLPETQFSEASDALLDAAKQVREFRGIRKEREDLLQSKRELRTELGRTRIERGEARDKLALEQRNVAAWRDKARRLEETNERLRTERNADYDSNELGAVADRLDEDNQATDAKTVRAGSASLARLQRQLDEDRKLLKDAYATLKHFDQAAWVYRVWDDNTPELWDTLIVPAGAREDATAVLAKIRKAIDA